MKFYDDQEVWKNYLKYLCNWAIEHHDVSNKYKKPLNFIDWKNRNYGFYIKCLNPYEIVFIKI